MKNFIILCIGFLLSASAVAFEITETSSDYDDHSVTVASLTDLDATLGVRITASHGIVVDNSVSIDSRSLIVSDKIVYASIVLDKRCTPRIRDDVT